ncbi:ROK family protein [Enterococcus sp. BWB1-3]|uniref:fructokinase ScrK n=1 Tax=unclassified Enterococcus TaxID=2608891 RepID=UPI001923DAE5|nr:MULTISPECIES: fructokinase ScrK [unclassified Enterococcus]MBL1229998.1 ROK family protein [Enterococcus sp. BWB1-3]MCB5952461.1 ROK family protein [Enterococcus sp. BWT-B8]
MSDILLGSIEAGGTKFVCAVGNTDFEVQESVVFSTGNPEETMEKVAAFFSAHTVSAIAVGSFGPVDVNPDSSDYGKILATPKLEWRGFNILKALRKHFDFPIFLTTDVNSSAFGEYVKGAAVESNSCVYFTVGTGIGGGAIQNGEFIGGLTHAEMGHVFVKRHPLDMDFEGVCPSHGADCLEGLASGPSLEARTGIKGEEVDETHIIWEIEAYYIAQLAFNTRLNFSPEKIIFGGGVMQQDHLMKKVRSIFTELNNGYVDVPDLDNYIVNPAISENGSATVGNFALALRELKR